MTTAELIEALQEIDPSGELQVSFNNHTVSELYVGPANLNGPFEHIHPDMDGNNMVTYRTLGDIVYLVSKCAKSEIMDNADVLVDFSEIEKTEPNQVLYEIEAQVEQHRSTSQFFKDFVINE